MDEKAKRPGVASGAPQNKVGGPEDQSSGLAESPWWNSPALAYAKGMQDGAQLALEEIAGVLVDVLGSGRQAHDRATPIEVLIRHRDQAAARGGRRWVA